MSTERRYVNGWHIGDDHCHKAEWDAVRERERAAREGTVDD